MARVTAIFLSCVLLSASSLLASNVEETYQAALTQEKGEGNLEEAIRLYRQVIEAHEKGEGDEKMAARAQLRIEVCQEKLASERQMEALRQQLVRQQEQMERQLEASQRLPLRADQAPILEHEDYNHYANTPPVIPYAHKEVAEVPWQWKFRLEVDRWYPQRHRDYATLDFDDSEWATINIGRAWEDQGYAGYDKGAWYRTTFTVAADSVQPVLMAFGGVDKDAFVYVNGQSVGQHHEWDRPFILDISDHVVRDGENAVALYVYDGAYMGGVYGLINVHQPTTEVETDDFAANRGDSAKRIVLVPSDVEVREIKKGEPAPDFAVVDIHGDTLRLADFRGRHVLLDFWATTCGPCIKDTPELKGIYTKQAHGLEIIGISTNSRREPVLRYVEKNRIEWPQVLILENETPPISKKYNISGIPSYVWIGPDGVVINPELRGDLDDLYDAF